MWSWALKIAIALRRFNECIIIRNKIFYGVAWLILQCVYMFFGTKCVVYLMDTSSMIEMLYIILFFWPIPLVDCCLNRDRQNLANTWLLYLLKNCHSYFEVDKQLFTSILENTFNLIDFGHSNDSLSYIMHLITFKCILRQHIEKTKQQETL